jgi:hypothetical protein
MRSTAAASVLLPSASPVLRCPPVVLLLLFRAAATLFLFVLLHESTTPTRLPTSTANSGGGVVTALAVVVVVPSAQSRGLLQRGPRGLFRWCGPSSRNSGSDGSSCSSRRRGALHLSSSSDKNYNSRDPFGYLTAVREDVKQAGYELAWDEAVQWLVRNVVADASGRRNDPGSSSNDSASDRRRLELAAEDCLARAWNWRSRAVVTGAVARRFLPPPTPPDAAQLQQSVRWLRTGPLRLGGCDGDAVGDDCDDDAAAEARRNPLALAILAHPATYLVGPEQTYQRALSVAPAKYRRDPETFRNLVLHDPTVLRCTYNCADTDDGACQSECGNCWVTFTNK